MPSSNVPKIIFFIPTLLKGEPQDQIYKAYITIRMGRENMDFLIIWKCIQIKSFD